MFIKQRKEFENLAFKRINHLLKRGIYIFDYEDNSIRKLKFSEIFNPKKILFFHIHFSKGTSKTSSVSFKNGACKIVILSKEAECKAFYLWKTTYEMAVNSYKFYKVFPLKKCNILSFDDEKLAVEMEYLSGEPRRDKQSILLLEKDYFNALWSDTNLLVFTNGQLLGLSHGDFKWDNVIWQSESAYKIIDFDFCGMRPFLFDLIHLHKSINSTGKDLYQFFERNAEIIHKILVKYDINFELDNSDLVLFDYIQWELQNNPLGSKEYCFFDDFGKRKFCKSFELLKNSK